MDNLLIFGATKNLGFFIAKYALLQKKYNILAMARKDSNLDSLNYLKVDTITGDAFNIDDCINVIESCKPKYIISTIGGKDKEGNRIDAIGNINIIKAISSYKIAHFVLVTSFGVGNQNYLLSSRAKELLNDSLLAKYEAEQYLQKTKIPWTIIRPYGLINDIPMNNYHILDEKASLNNYKKYKAISREDVAKAILEILSNEKYLDKVLTIVNYG